MKEAFTGTRHSQLIWRLGQSREQAEGALPVDCLSEEIPPVDCLSEGIPLSGCLFADCCCSSPFARSDCCFSPPLLGFCQEKSSLLVGCQLLAPRRKQLPVSRNLSFLRSSPCFLPCFPSCCCCWLQSSTPFSAMSSLCFRNVVSLYSSKAHPCPQKVQQLQVEVD